MVAAMPHASAGTVKGIKSAIRFGNTPLDSYVAPPRLGEHTREILTELLGLDACKIDALTRAGAI